MRSLALVAFSILVGCTSPDPVVGGWSSPAEPEGLNISSRTTGAIEGTFRTGDHVISFSSVTDGAVTSHFELKGAVITYVNDLTAGSGKMTASGELSAADHELVLAFVDALGKQFIQEVDSEDLLPSNELMLARMSSHLAIAPVGVELTSYDYVNARDVRYLPCGRQWTWNYQYYTGTWYQLLTGQGGSCEGRCGVGCGWDDTYWFRWGTGVYSMDCALHDYGLQAWDYAIDDYAASSNCKSGI